MCRNLPGLRSFFTISLVQRNSRKETARDSPFLELTLAASIRGRKVKGLCPALEGRGTAIAVDGWKWTQFLGRFHMRRISQSISFAVLASWIRQQG